MFSAVPARAPLTRISAKVSSPSQRRITDSQPSRSAPTSKRRLYTKSFSISLSASVSLSRQNGSSMHPAVSRSWYTEPGTAAGTAPNALAGISRVHAPLREIVFMYFLLMYSFFVFVCAQVAASSANRSSRVMFLSHFLLL